VKTGIQCFLKVMYRFPASAGMTIFSGAVRLFKNGWLQGPEVKSLDGFAKSVRGKAREA
jgi:hypothetical protein